MVYFVCKTGPG